MVMGTVVVTLVVVIKAVVMGTAAAAAAAAETCHLEGEVRTRGLRASVIGKRREVFGRHQRSLVIPRDAHRAVRWMRGWGSGVGC